MNKKTLAVELSKIKNFKKPKIKLEQYETNSEIAAEILWFAFLNNDIKGKLILDMGCGTGIFGIGALILGAKKVIFVEKDKDAVNILKENLSKFKNYNIIPKDIKEIKNKADVILQNPPFGVKQKHADKLFLEKAFKLSGRIYSIHKIESKEFLKKFAKDNNFNTKLILKFDLPLKASYKFHKKPVKKIKVGCWIFNKL